MIDLGLSFLFVCVLVVVEGIRARMHTEEMLDAAELKRVSDLRAGVWP